MADTKVDPSTGFVSISLTPQERREKEYQKRVNKLEMEIIELKKEIEEIKEALFFSNK